MPTIRKTKVEFEGRIEEREVIVEEEHVSVWPEGAELKYVGKPIRRIDGVARVTGKAKYTHDVSPAGMLWGRFLRCPHPHAKLISIDSSKAEALPGVWLVWHRDQNAGIQQLDGKGIFQTELAYEGAEVAYVVADNERVLVKALTLIEVEYELLDFTPTLSEAVSEGAPDAVLSKPGNLINPDGQIYSRGDIAQGEAEADVIVDLDFSSPTAVHCCMEPHGSMVLWEGDLVTTYHSTQGVFSTRSSLANALDIPQDRVRAVCNYMGGGFGSKWGAEAFTLMAAQAAKLTGRPVHSMLTREEEHLVAGYRPPSQQQVRIGAKKDGTLTFIEHKANVATGAFGGGGSIIGGPTKDLYECPNVYTLVNAYRVNTDAGRAFRAPGYVQGAFALEGAMDALAEKLGMDPLELRLKNYAELSPARGIPYTAKRLKQAYKLGAERFNWAKREDRRPADGPWRRGFGLASQIWGGGGGPPANAMVKLLPDGTVEVFAGVQDIGTGVKTIIAQVAAEEMGLPLDAFRSVVGDTLTTPFGPGSGGSVTLASITPAVREAAYDALSQAVALGAVMLGLPDAVMEDFDIKDGEIIYRADPDKHLSYKEIAAKMGNYMIVGKGARGPNPDNEALNTFGVQYAEVLVNELTGQVKVKKIVAVHDIGRIVNPMTAESQVYGGVLQGMGFALTEERIIDKRTGKKLNANMEDYRVPVIGDVPEIEVYFIDTADEKANSVGSKGLGEPPIIPTPGAIANAVADATGVRMFDLPITPARLLSALRSA